MTGQPQSKYCPAMIKHVTLLTLLLGVAACGGEGSGSAPAAGAGTTGSAAAATATTTAAAAVATTGLTPGKIEANIKALLFKKVSGEGLMYYFEAATLNGEKQFNAYIADDEKKTGSFKCSLKGDPKIADKTMVTFEGTLKSKGWVDDCTIQKK